MAAPADYDGDGAVDFAVYRPLTGTWYVRNQFSIPWQSRFGNPVPLDVESRVDVPVPMDRDGDGRTEMNIFRRDTGTWYFLDPLSGATSTLSWGRPFARDAPIGARGPLWNIPNVTGG